MGDLEPGLCMKTLAFGEKPERQVGKEAAVGQDEARGKYRQNSRQRRAFEPTHPFRDAPGGNSENGDRGQDDTQAEAVASDENHPVVGFVKRNGAQQQNERPGARDHSSYHTY